MSTVLTDEPSPAAPSAPKVRPAKGWYAVFAGVIAVSLLAGLGIWFVGKRSVDSTISSYARFVAPNTADLRFKRAGQYLVYYEYDSKIDGERVTAPPTPPPGIVLDLKDEAGESLELRRVGQEFRYDTGDHRAVSLRRVTIPRQGLYRLSASAPGLDRFVISVGRGSTPTTDGSTRTAVLVGSIGSILGVIGLITVGILRSRSRAGLSIAVASAWAPAASPASTPPPPPPPISGSVPTTPPPFAPTAPMTPASGSSTPPPPPPPPPPAKPAGGDTPPATTGWAPPATGGATEPGGSAGRPPGGTLPPPPS